MSQFTVYTGPACSHCEAAKTMLNERGLEFEERDISEPSVLAELKERLPRSRAIPQIFLDGEHLGNDEDLRLYLER